MLDLTGVKNIIFDLGGVILNIDYNLTAKAFQNLGISNFNEMYSQAKQNHVFDNLEIGKLSLNDFRNYIKNNVETTDNEIDKAWNAMLLNLPADRIETLKKIKMKYRVFLLSNTNKIHIKAFRKIIENTYGQNIFDSIFEQQYYSSEIGLRKPNKDCFDFVLNENVLKASETLFIDDSVQHVRGAIKAGLRAHHLQLGEDIITLFPDKAQ